MRSKLSSWSRLRSIERADGSKSAEPRKAHRLYHHEVTSADREVPPGNADRLPAAESASDLGEDAQALHRLGNIARRVLHAPVVIVSHASAAGSLVARCVDLDHDELIAGTALSHSTCLELLAEGGPLVINDTRLDGRTAAQRAARLGIVAYLGVPLNDHDGTVVGSFCAIDRKPRQWSAADIDLLEDLGASVTTEIELRERARRLDNSRSGMHALIDALPTFVGLLDSSGRVTYVNAAALDAAGTTLADVTGVPLWRTRWWTPASVDVVREAIDRCAAGETCRFDVEFRAGAGITIMVDLRLTPILDNLGSVHAIVPFASDITERTRSHQELLVAADMESVARLRAERMFELARSLTGASDVTTILQRTGRIAGELVGAAFANIGRIDPDTDEIELLHGEGVDPEILKRWPRVGLDSTTPLGLALLTGRPVEVGRAEQIAAMFPIGAGDAAAAGLQALAVYPIRHGRAAMGFAWAHPVDFHDELRETLDTVIDLVDLGLDRAEASERDRRVAEQLQRSMLPLRLPEVPGASLGALYEAGTRGLEVGGDWYDVVITPENRYVLGLGDVVGHGLQAAAAMGQMRTAFAALAPTLSLEDLVERLSRFAMDVHGAQYSTMVVADFDPTTGALRVVSAGHVPPVIRRVDTSVEQLPDGGPPLGIDVGAGRTVVEDVLRPGDTLIMYTDGLVERRDECIDVGLLRLAAALTSTGSTSGQLMPIALFNALGRPRADDVAVLALVRASVCT